MSEVLVNLLISHNFQSASEDFPKSFQKGWQVHEREAQKKASVAAYFCDQAGNNDLNQGVFFSEIANKPPEKSVILKVFCDFHLTFEIDFGMAR